jgi:hypothetical protein
MIGQVPEAWQHLIPFNPMNNPNFLTPPQRKDLSKDLREENISIKHIDKILCYRYEIFTVV